MMEKKQAIIGIAIVVVLGLFAVVYMQIFGKATPEPTAMTTVSGAPDMPNTPTPPAGSDKDTSAVSSAPTIPTSVPVAQPQTATDVANNISAQMDNEGRAIDVESQAEANQSQTDSNALNSAYSVDSSL